ncbi:MAG: 16S rRNA (cytosine(1402)-N(4))-methyltransferase RsmH [Saezia sp.]
MNNVLKHQTVMLQEAVDAVFSRPDGVYVDGTFGRGGHTRELLTRINDLGRIHALDRDPQAAVAAAEIQDKRFSFVQKEFSRLASVFPEASLDGLLLDVGVSSPQIDDPQRGFSFRFDGPLDMRMDPSQGESAADFLAQASAQEIAQVIKSYGEERFASQIARTIVARRENGELMTTTSALAKLVGSVVRTREAGQSPATRTFQALRIYVNRELEQLEQALEAALTLLKPEGRLVVISFHSLEDRIVKQFMVKHSRFEPDRRVPFAQPPEMLLKDVKKSKPSASEIAGNPRARSAILRSATRTAGVCGALA